MKNASRRSFIISAALIPAACRTSAERRSSLFTAPGRRPLGNTGLEVSQLGFGSEAVSDVSVFERALDSGVNFFDTARNYQGGNAERALAAALGGKRKDVILATRSYASDARQLQADLDASLRELKTDHVDIWYIGNKLTPEDVSDEMLAVQAAAQKAGKLRFRGLSTHRIGAMADFAITRKFDVVQIPYSFAVGTSRDPYNMEGGGLDEALDRLKTAKIGVVAMKVMAGGYRTGPLGEKNASAFGAALRWALRNDRVQTTSVRMTDMDQLEDNLRALTADFTDNDRKLLAAYTDSVSPVLCRMCGACDGCCPKGAPVSDVVRYVMYAEGYGQFEMGRSRFQSHVGKLPCGSCENCAVRCPNGVRIRERMERAAALFC
jgi:aryl-alcohol dehydrogenase-like predicted oxidoreductase